MVNSAKTPHSIQLPHDDNTIESGIAYLAFSSLAIHGVASCEGEKIPVALQRSVSFPARRFTGSRVVACNEKDGWDSVPLPVGKPHLELELGECLGQGRIGLVYVARVVAVLDRLGGVPMPNPPLDVSMELVLKFVRPTNCRSLARETWFYERLAEEQGFQGAVVPLSYGLFTTSTASIQSPSLAPVEIKPWIDTDGQRVPLDFTESQKKYGDELPDEKPIDPYYDDGRTCRKDSPWCEWRPDPENPLLSVLVLEKLGETYSRKIFAKDGRSREDIADLIDDLSAATIKHRDFKSNNLVRSRSNVVCPRHGYVHQWRVIDFDMSERWAKTAKKDDKFFPRHNRLEYVENDCHEFPVLFWMSLC